MVTIGIEVLFQLLHILGAATSEECRHTFTESQGEFRPPDSNQDGYYDNDLACDWTIITDHGKIIWLFILEFNVQTDDQCIYDNLKIYDGFDDSSPLFGTYCGDMSVNESCIPPKIRSSSNGLYVQFHSDDRMTAGGVRAVFVSAEGNSWRRWPQGKYSIPMSIYGCPDQELNNWSHGSYNITVSTDQTYDLEGVNEDGDVFRWKKSDLLLLGPFGGYTFQINFCTKYQTALEPETRYLYDDGHGQQMYLDLAEWPRGEYGIFNIHERIKELYKPRPDYKDEIQCPKGFLNKELKLPGIDSYAAYGRTPTSSFNCSTEYHIGDTKIEYCDLTFDVCMKHVRDPDVDRVEDLRLPFMVMANILDTWFPWCIVRMHFNSPDRPSGRASTSWHIDYLHKWKLFRTLSNFVIVILLQYFCSLVMVCL